MSRSSIHLVVTAIVLFAAMWIMDRSWKSSDVQSSNDLSRDESLPQPAFARLQPDEFFGSVVSVQFSPDGRYLAAGVKRENPKYEWPAPQGICVWDLRNRKLAYYAANLEPDVFAFSPDSSRLAVARNMSRSGNDQSPERILILDVATGRELRHYDFGWRLYRMKFAPDGKRLYYTLSDPVHLYALDLKPGIVTPLYDGLVSPKSERMRPFSMDFSERTLTAACSDQVGESYLFQCGPQVPIVVEFGRIAAWQHVRISPDGSLIASIDEKPLKCFRAPSGEAISVPTTGPINHGEFSPDSRRFAYIGEYGRRVHFLDIARGKFASSLDCTNDRVDCLAYDARGVTLATGSRDGSVTLWDLRGANQSRFVHAAEPKATNDDEHDFFRQPRSPAVGTKVVLNTSKPHFIFGEEINVEFVWHNTSKRLWSFELGGDYRGATRHLNFSVEAIHSSGEPAPDPHPQQMCMGGLMHGVELVPGGKHSQTIDLLAYRRLEKPGTYRIRASHGGPVGETTIEVREPTLTEAKALLERIDAAQAEAKKMNPTSKLTAYRRLTHPVYLPLLVERARAGSRGAIDSLGQMPHPDATKALIEALNNPDPKFVAEVEEALYLRLPDPELEGKLRSRNIFDDPYADPRKYLRDSSWRPEFAKDVRAHAKRCLEKRDEANLFRGGFVLSCVGTIDDVPVVLSAFDVAVAMAQGKPLTKDRYPRAPYYCEELRRAMQMLIDRGARPPAEPKTPGEKVLFVETVSRRDDFRPANWQQTFLGVLRDRLDYVREAAIKCVPTWCPKAIGDIIPELLRDPHIDVQTAALHLAARLQHVEWKPALVECFAKATEQWQFRAAVEALHQHFSFIERIEIHVAKISDSNAEIASQSVGMMTGIFHDSSGGSNGIQLETPEKRKACQQAWQKFIAANRDKFTKRQPFSLLDSSIPKEDLFPGFKFSMPRKGRDVEWESVD